MKMSAVIDFNESQLCWKSTFLLDEQKARIQRNEYQSSNNN
jgi:hypothetical protein